MAITHTANARNAAANAVVGLIDVGTAYATGRLVVFDVNNIVLTTLLFANPSFQAAVGGVCLANPVSNDVAPIAGGVPFRYEAQDRNGNYVFRGSCGPTGDLGDNGQAIPPATPTSVSGFQYAAPL